MIVARTGRQRGQALVLALFLLVLGAAALVQMFNGGQIIAGKTRLVHATDAAAYSAALMQARALNFHAYVNRAHIAHQVAMAHLVTFSSWARFGDTEAMRLAASNPPLGVITSFFGIDHGKAYASAAGAVGQGGALASAFDAHDRTVHQVLVVAQRAVLQSLAQQRDDTVEAVLAANYEGEVAPRGEWLADDLAGGLRWRGGSDRTTLRDMAADAVQPYGFLKPRNHIARSLLPVSARCPTWRHELRRNGQTSQLGFEGWAATDTQSWHALRSNKWIGCYYREYPMGYAFAASGGMAAGLPDGPDIPTDFSAEDFWRWASRQSDWNIFGGSSNPLAQGWANAAPVTLGGRGLPGHVDLSRGRESLRFVLHVRQPQRALRTTDGAGQVRAGAQRLNMPTQAAGGNVGAMAAAETYYARPVPRPDGRNERANLFQPYWQARLVAVTDAERAQARTRQGHR